MPHTQPIANKPNINTVVFGNLVIKPWFPGYYPEDVVGHDPIDTLYVCKCCFKYTRDPGFYVTHSKICEHHTSGLPDGASLIYENLTYSIYVLDGATHSLFAQNLSLFAKLWLDNKSVFFDVSGFLYYLLVLQPTPQPSRPVHRRGRRKVKQEEKELTVHEVAEEQTSGQIVGFFSKEKLSWDNNNLACILVFPPFQRRGLGKLLMAISYALAKQEGKIGGPEKPLSDMGRKSYLMFWSQETARFVIERMEDCRLKGRPKLEVTVKDITAETGIAGDDVIEAIAAIGLGHWERKIKEEKDNDNESKQEVDNRVWSISRLAMIEWVRKHGGCKRMIDPHGFVRPIKEEPLN